MHTELQEKIGQMLLVGFKGTELQSNDPIAIAIKARQIGGVILFDYDYPTQSFDHNIKNPEQVKTLTQQLQNYQKMANPVHPLFVSIDYEGGLVNRLKEQFGFPKTMTASELALKTITEAKHAAHNMAKTLHACGINMNFAPVVDINVNPESPAIGKLGRSFSHDPHQVTLYAKLFMEAQRNQGIVSVLKHFPGHGSAQSDTHLGYVDVTDTWQSCELKPYQELLANQDVAMVMTAHVIHRGLDPAAYPASLSASITTHLLRQQLGYQGIVVTDDLQMKAIANHYTLPELLKLAINAGADILAFGNQLSQSWQDPKELIDHIYTAVKKKEIAESRIHESYARIVRLKEKIK